MNNPKISVCLPTYNRVGYAKEAIKSVINQTFGDFELIVSDDASTEDVESMVQSFDDRRIKCFRQEINLGFIKNWNFCLINSSGKYIKIMGDDDVLLPNCLEESIRILEKEEFVGMVCSDYWTIDGNGNFINNHQFNDESFRIFKKNKIEMGKKFIKEYLLGRRRVGLPSAILFKKDLLKIVGNFDESAGPPADIDLWLRILQISDFYYIDEKLLKMRWHKDNLSKKLEEDLFYYKYVINLLSKNYCVVKRCFCLTEKIKLFFIYSRIIFKKVFNFKLLNHGKVFLRDIIMLIKLIF